MHSSFRHLGNISFRWWWDFWNKKEIINLFVENEETGCFGHLKKLRFLQRGNSSKPSSSANSLFWPTFTKRKNHLIWKLSACHLLSKVYTTHAKLHKKLLLLMVLSKRKTEWPKGVKHSQGFQVWNFLDIFDTILASRSHRNDL